MKLLLQVSVLIAVSGQRINNVVFVITFVFSYIFILQLRESDQSAITSSLIERKNSTIIKGDCEMSLRSSSQQPPGIHVKCDRLQPRIKLVT